MIKTAVFGGTFNPFHIGHYEMLKCLCGLDYIDRVFVMPDNVPPHKSCEFLASDSDRIRMCEIACRDFSKAELCTVEFEREGKSYSYDTMLCLKEKFPDNEFYLVCGGDMIATLDSWYRFNDLKDITKFIAFKRGNDTSFNDNIGRLTALGAEIVALDCEITDISSTELRKNPERKYFTKEIYDYIKDKKVYNGIR